MTINDITTAKNFEIEVTASALNKYGNWYLQDEYLEFKQGTIFSDSVAAWATFDKWLENTHIRLTVRNGETLYEQKWYDGQSWVNAWGSESTGDDEETIKNIVEMIAAGEWHDILAYDK